MGFVRVAAAAAVALVLGAAWPGGALAQTPPPEWRALASAEPVFDVALDEDADEGWAVMWEGDTVTIYRLRFPLDGPPSLEAPVEFTTTWPHPPRLALAPGYALVTTEQGVFRFDGTSWSHVPITGDSFFQGSVGVSVDPFDLARVVVSSPGGTFAEDVATSLDSGVSWTSETVATESLGPVATAAGAITLFLRDIQAQPWVYSPATGVWGTLTASSIRARDAIVLADGSVVAVGFAGVVGVGGAGEELVVTAGLGGDPDFERVTGRGEEVWILGSDGTIFHVPDPADPHARTLLPETQLLDSHALGSWSEGRFVVTGHDGAGPILYWRNRPPIAHPDAMPLSLLEGDAAGQVLPVALDPDGDDLTLVTIPGDACTIVDFPDRTLTVTEVGFTPDQIQVQVALAEADPVDCPGEEGWAIACTFEVTDDEYTEAFAASGTVVSPPPAIQGLLAPNEVASGEEVEVTAQGLAGCGLEALSVEVLDGEDPFALDDLEVSDATVRFTPVLSPGAEDVVLTVRVTATDRDGRFVTVETDVTVIAPPPLPAASIVNCPAEMVAGALFTFEAVDVTPEGNSVATYEWEVADATGVTAVPDGASYDVTVDDECDYDRTLTITVTPRDGDGVAGEPDVCEVPVVSAGLPTVETVTLTPEPVTENDEVRLDVGFGGICRAAWSITITADGGEPPLTFGPFQNPADAESHGFGPLDAGTYSVEVRVTDGGDHEDVVSVPLVVGFAPARLDRVVCDPARFSDETHVFTAFESTDSGTITAYEWTVTLGGAPWEPDTTPGETFTATPDPCDHGEIVDVRVRPIDGDGTPGAEVACDPFVLQPRTETAVDDLVVGSAELPPWPGERLDVSATVAGTCVTAVTVDVLEGAQHVLGPMDLGGDGGPVATAFDAPEPAGPIATYTVRMTVQAGAGDPVVEFVDVDVHRQPRAALDCASLSPRAGEVLVVDGAHPESGPIESYAWDVRLDGTEAGSGEASTWSVPLVCEDAGGALTVAVTPVGAGGRTGEPVSCDPVTVEGPLPPTAQIVSPMPEDVFAGDTVTVSVAAASGCNLVTAGIEVLDPVGTVRVAADEVIWDDDETAHFPAPAATDGADAVTYTVRFAVTDSAGGEAADTAELVVHTVPALAGCHADGDDPHGFVAEAGEGAVAGHAWAWSLGEAGGETTTDGPRFLAEPDRCAHGETLAVSVRPVHPLGREGEAVACPTVVVAHDGAPPALVVDPAPRTLSLGAGDGRLGLDAEVRDCPADPMTVHWTLVDPLAGVRLEGPGASGEMAVQDGVPGDYAVDVVVSAEHAQAVLDAGEPLLVEVFAASGPGGTTAPVTIEIYVERGDPQVAIHLVLDAPTAREASPGDLVVIAGELHVDAPFSLPEVDIPLTGGLEVVPGTFHLAADCADAPHSPELAAVNGASPGAAGALRVPDLGPGCRAFTLVARRGFGPPDLFASGCTWRPGNGDGPRAAACTGGLSARVSRLPGLGCAAAPEGRAPAAAIAAVALLLLWRLRRSVLLADAA